MTATDSTAVRALSAQALGTWAKSQRDEQFHTELVGWLPLDQHLDDAAGVAGKLWDEWASTAIKRIIAEPFAGDVDRARAFYVWLASVHDVGKVSPAFSVQVSELADDMTRLGFDIDPSLAGSEERRRARHEVVSYIAIVTWLTERHAFTPDRAAQYASILAAHHGLPPNHAQLNAAQERGERLVGADVWAWVRTEFLDRAAWMHVTPGDIDSWRDIDLPQTAQVLLSALVIMADWIASDEKLFPYAALGERPTDSTEVRLGTAWKSLGFPGPWHAAEPEHDLQKFFASRFTLPDGATIHPLQTAMMVAASEVPEPALMILEAEMGAGKTEAALAAAEILAARFERGGIFIALPTQATTDSMFSRVMIWARELGLDSPNTAFLARGKSQLNEEYAALVKDAHFRSIGEDGLFRSNTSQESTIAHQWFTSSKRGPLANLVVGTIDQGLFSALRSRHLMLRHLALAGKVVIIDEAHAYSTFMNVYLDRALTWLGAYGVPVVLLSATLPSARRRELIAAYDDGRRRAKSASKPSRQDRKESKARYDVLDGDIGYPSITLSQAGGTPLILTPPSVSAPKTVTLGTIDDTPEALVGVIRQALRDGGCVAIIHNTVSRVQDTARFLRAEFPGTDILVAHSRFLAVDRVAKDAGLLDMFGSPQRSTGRPKTHIVVASQVIEQSLDLDFDLMISDLAPIDLLLQRAGRLHRHHRGADQSERPAALRTPRLVVTGADWAAEPPEPYRASGKIYSPHILYRTLAVLRDRMTLEFPTDIPPLVQTVYGPDTVGPESWAEILAAAAEAHAASTEQKKRAGEHFLLGAPQRDGAGLLGWVYGNADDPANEATGQAAVRDGEETLEVLVVQRSADGELRTPSWIPHNGGIAIPMDRPPERWLARTILGCSIRLPPWMCRGQIDRHIAALEREFDLPFWHASRDLKGELVLVLDENGRGSLNGYRITYDNDMGLEVTRDE